MRRGGPQRLAPPFFFLDALMNVVRVADKPAVTVIAKPPLSLGSRREGGSLARAAGAVMLVLAPAALLAAAVSSTVDYGAGMQTGDSPAPAIAALLHGDLQAMAAHQPIIGLTSILLRAPFVALSDALGGGLMLQYRLGVFACAAVVGLVGVMLAGHARRRGRSPMLIALVVALMSVNLLTVGARLGGHPEELLCGALCLGAVLAAIDGRAILAGALLGLAVATKQWALAAAVPVALACPRRRGALLAAALVVGTPLALALPLADPAAFMSATRLIGDLHETYAQSWWWPLAATHTVTVHGLAGAVTETAHLLPFGLSRTDVSWLPLAAAATLGWRYRRVRTGAEALDAIDPRSDPADAIGLLALVLLLRCTLDPSFCSYYLVPFQIALLAWELLRRPGAPLGSLLAIAGFGLILRFATFAPLVALSALLTVGLGVYLGLATLRRDSASVPGVGVLR
jgi:hypothetical protein